MSESLTLVLVTICFIVFVYNIVLYYQRNRRIFELCAKINGPLAFPIIGSSYILWGGTRKMLVTFVEQLDKYKPILKLWLGPKPGFVLANPEHVKIVLNNSLERENGYKYLRPVFGYGLFTRSVADWENHRKTIVSTFSPQILQSFLAYFNHYSKIFVEKIESKARDEYLDVFPMITQCTLDIMCSTVMGVKMNAMEEENPFILWMTKVAEYSIIRMFNIYYWPDCIWNLFPISKKTTELDNKIQNFVDAVIRHKRKEGRQTKIAKKIFLDHLIELTDNDNTWNDDDLSHETRSVIMAGSDATAITLSYCFVMLAMFPNVQTRIHDELDTIFGDSERNVGVQDLSQMLYLERFIKETLRVFPVTSIIARELVEDTDLGEYVLPKGSSIGIPIFYIHRSPEYWPNPLKFDPDRFLPEEVAKRHPCTFLPFSYGPRNCIGYRYAYMIMKVILANFLRKCEVYSTSYEKITDLKVKMDVATKCDEGYPCKLRYRTK